MFKKSLFFTIFLIATGVHGFSMEEPINMRSYIIPVELDAQDLYWDLVPGEQIYVRIDYVTRPGGEVLFSEPSEQIWWLKEKPVLFLGSTGESLPSEVMSRKQVFIEVLWDDEPLLSEPVLLFLNEDKVEVSRHGSGKETLEKALGKRLVSVDSSYIAQIANYMVGNVATLDIRGDSMTIQQNGSFGGTLMTSGLTTSGFSMGTGAASGKVLTSDVNGVASWEDPSGSSSLTLPYVGSGVSTQSDDLFSITNTGTRGKAAYFYNYDSSNPDPTVKMESESPGTVLFLKTNLYTNPNDTLHVENGGAGNAGYFENSDTSNNSNTLKVASFAPGAALEVTTNYTGTDYNKGMAAKFATLDENSKGDTVQIGNQSDLGGTALSVTHFGTSGNACQFENNDISNPSPVILSQTYGSGPAIRAYSHNNSTVYNKGNAAHFQSMNDNSKGSVVLIENSSTSGAIGLDVQVTGDDGSAGSFTSSSDGAPTLFAETTGDSNVLHVYAKNGASTKAAFLAECSGAGPVADFHKRNGGSPAIYVTNAGDSLALDIENVWTNSTAAVIEAVHKGKGSAGIFKFDGGGQNPSPVLQAINDYGWGASIKGVTAYDSATYSEGQAAVFETINELTSADTIAVSNYGVGDSVAAYSEGSGGHAGYFATKSSANTSPTIKVISASSSAAAYFQGDVAVIGTLSKSAGSFKIDHPLDPENKTLSHSFVESPDMMNIYNGNTILDGRGEAWIELPEWFEALNRDYRYQLTTIGGGALVYINSKLADNQFQVAGGYEGLEVSWQITGIRQDAYATQHPIVVEQDKDPDEKGYYLTPEAHGFEKTRQIGYQKNSRKEQ